MKKIISLLMIFFLMPFAMAQEDVSAGITPDSPIYGLEIALEKIGNALTFDVSQKAERRLLQARERIEEAKVMIQENKDEKAQEALDRHDEIIDEIADDVRDPENQRLGEIISIRVRLEAYERHLEQKRERLEEEGLTDQQKARLEMHIILFEGKVGMLESVTGDVQEEIEEEIEVIEIEEEFDELEDDGNLDDVREMVQKQITEVKKRLGREDA